MAERTANRMTLDEIAAVARLGSWNMRQQGGDGPTLTKAFAGDFLITRADQVEPPVDFTIKLTLTVADAQQLAAVLRGEADRG